MAKIKGKGAMSYSEMMNRPEYNKIFDEVYEHGEGGPLGNLPNQGIDPLTGEPLYFSTHIKGNLTSNTKEAVAGAGNPQTAMLKELSDFLQATQTADMSGGYFDEGMRMYRDEFNMNEANNLGAVSGSSNPYITNKNTQFVNFGNIEDEGQMTIEAMKNFKESKAGGWRKGLGGQPSSTYHTSSDSATGWESSGRAIEREFLDSNRNIWFDPKTDKYYTAWSIGKLGGKTREISEKRYNKIKDRMAKRQAKKNTQTQKQIDKVSTWHDDNTAIDNTTTIKNTDNQVFDAVKGQNELDLNNL